MATSTPWGAAQAVRNIARGIRSVSTAGHGGVFVSPTKNALIPAYMRNDSGAYEEDSEWAIPALVFEAEWRAWADTTSWTTGDFQIECAWDSLKNWYPDAYEKFSGKTLEVGESYERDKQTLNAKVRESFVVSAAWGDWQEGIPKGMVGLLARRASDGDQIYCLAQKEEYATRSNLVIGQAKVFVVDLARHQTVPMPQYVR